MTDPGAQKVTTRHLARCAYLYVRQSSLRQVVEHQESARRQYALRDRAAALGWQLDQIVVIDQDQGVSGASTADREGFARLVSEVGMGRVGIVLGLEVSRLARNNADWHRLLEICAVTLHRQAERGVDRWRSVGRDRDAHRRPPGTRDIRPPTRYLGPRSPPPSPRTNPTACRSITSASSESSHTQKRFAQTKTTHEVAPVFLKNEGRIEALFTLYFLALLLQALVERELRKAMERQNIQEIPLYPEERQCARPTTEQVLRLFSHAARNTLLREGKPLQNFHPQLTELQGQVLDLLGVPPKRFRVP